MAGEKCAAGARCFRRALAPALARRTLLYCSQLRSVCIHSSHVITFFVRAYCPTDIKNATNAIRNRSSFAPMSVPGAVSLNGLQLENNGSTFDWYQREEKL